MFGNMGDFMKQMQRVQKLMKDENFKPFISHPKVRAVFMDPSLQEVMKTQDPQKIMAHPKMESLKSDPEVLQLITKLDFNQLTNLE